MNANGRLLRRLLDEAQNFEHGAPPEEVNSYRHGLIRRLAAALEPLLKEAGPSVRNLAAEGVARAALPKYARRCPVDFSKGQPFETVDEAADMSRDAWNTLRPSIFHPLDGRRVCVACGWTVPDHRGWTPVPCPVCEAVRRLDRSLSLPHAAAKVNKSTSRYINDLMETEEGRALLLKVMRP